jgi:hypothetical protein
MWLLLQDVREQSVSAPVTPAKAGASGREGAAASVDEVPAFAGMTGYPLGWK